MPPHPVHPLNRLLKGLPVYQTADWYPTPWAELLTLVQSVPPLPQTRLAALKAGIAVLPTEALDMLEKSLVNPVAMAPYLRFTRKQRLTMQGLALLAPVQVGILASFLGRDRSNVFHTLQGLVSLGLVLRVRSGRNVYYRLPEGLRTME